MPGNRRQRPGRVAAVDAWASAAWAAGERLAADALVDAGLSPTTLLASQLLARWLRRHLAADGVCVDADLVEGAGVVDHLPPERRRAQAAWLVRLTAGDGRPSELRSSRATGDPAPLTAHELSAVVGTGTGAAAPVVRARPSRAQETSRRHVASAIPAGSLRSPDQRRFLEAVRAHPGLAMLRSDAYRNVLAVAEHLALWADWRTCTSRPTWDVLRERAGVSRRTVARCLVRLREAGLLGVVATGQAAHTTTTKADQGINLAAVYVLCAPADLRVVDESGTPPTEGSVSETHPTHTRAREKNNPPAPLRGQPDPAAPSGPSRPTVPDTDSRPTDPGRSPTSSQDQAERPALGVKRQLRVVETHDAGADDHDSAGGGAVTRRQRRAARLEIADQLRVRVWPLRPLSPAALAHVIADFVAAGWSAADLHRSLDYRPDGAPHPHDGSPSSEPHRLRGWLTWRLSSWRDDAGHPRLSPSQQIAAERRRQAALARARRERADAERALHRASLATGRSAEIIARMREQIAEANATWDERHRRDSSDR